mmetsp:Transcript_5295/g.9195  ORF Transcript_5295/g.9195 Transcript_5295/m.9195 type:complete len:119 (+) Transcript_5295:260-616(+)
MFKMMCMSTRAKPHDHNKGKRENNKKEAKKNWRSRRRRNDVCIYHNREGRKEIPAADAETRGETARVVGLVVDALIDDLQLQQLKKGGDSRPKCTGHDGRWKSTVLHPFYPFASCGKI